MSTLSRRLDRLPFSAFHRRLLLTGGLGYTFDAMDSASVAFILPLLAAKWDLSSAQIGLLASSTYVGYLFGAFFAGALGDLIGRKKVMMSALLIYTASSVCCTLSNQWSSFYGLRMVAGFGVGAESAIIAPYLSEFVGRRYRGRFVGSLAGFFSFGYLLAAALGYLLIGKAGLSYKVLLLITALPILMLLWWRRVLPESPRWLESQNRIEPARRIVEAIETAAMREGHVLETVVPEHEEPVKSPVTIMGNLKALGSGRLARITGSCWCVWIAIAFSYYAFFTWIPTLLMKGGLPIAKSFGFSTVIYAAQIPGYFSAAYLNERLGRRAVIGTYMVLGAVCALALALSRSPLEVMVAGSCVSFFMNGTFAGLYAYTSEVFPTRVRATGVGTSSAIGRLGAIGAPVLVGLVFPVWGLAGVFGITAAVLLAGAAAILIFGISTQGRSLEDIVNTPAEI